MPLRTRMQGTSDAITTLSNGCLCCTVRDDLVKALNKLWERRASIDHIIIETTGVTARARCVCVCVCACVRACVRAFVRV
jgi:G3E family GTPase